MTEPAGTNLDIDRYRAIKKVTLVGAVTNIFLAVLKIVLGYLGQSQALIADGVHSFSDLLSDAVVIYASKHGSQGADDDHPYGHARIETLATVVIGVLLILAALGIISDAAHRLFVPELLMHPSMIAIVAAVISVAANEGLTQYTLVVARKVNSNMLRANAWHHRSDAVSSLVVIVGVVGTMSGLPYLDAIAAMVVAVMISRMGWGLIQTSVSELIDTGLDSEQVDLIREEIKGVDGVTELHMLRTRRMGAHALVDVHILVDPRVSVSEGHLIGETVRRRLIERVDEINDVTVHIDPEDDEKYPVSIGLPSRPEMEQQLRECWQGLVSSEVDFGLTLHYLEGTVSIEVCLPLTAVASIDQAQGLSKQLLERSQGLPHVSEVRIYFE